MLRKVLESQAGHPQANWLLSNVRKATSRDHVEVLERLIKEEGRNPRALAFLNYGLGKELEDLEEWDKAFDAFARRAKDRRSTIEFDEKSEIEMYKAFGDNFTSEWMSNGAAGHDDPSPIFVVGQPRTGTTLVERIITSHSQVHSAGELKQFSTCVRRMSDYREPRRYSARLAVLAATIDSEKLGQAYMARTVKMRGTLPRFGERFFDISYEETAPDLEPNARALVEFLELPWEDACLHFHEQEAPVTTASAVQVRQPAHTRSIGRWRRYENQLGLTRKTLQEQGVPIGDH